MKKKAAAVKKIAARGKAVLSGLKSRAKAKLAGASTRTKKPAAAMPAPNAAKKKSAAPAARSASVSASVTASASAKAAPLARPAEVRTLNPAFQKRTELPRTVYRPGLKTSIDSAPTERRSARLKRFKKIFLEQRNSILYNDRIIREDFNASVDDRFDEVDQASTDVEQSMRMRLRSREMLYLKKVDEALKRIEDGSFGLCEECGEEIEVRRLEARPTATLCVACKEEEERRENLSAAGREHKSMGEAFSRKYA
jgi:DnaK suppressor protein